MSEAPEPDSALKGRGKGNTSVVTVNTLGYVLFESPDVERLSHYYENALGFTVIQSNAEAAYLSADGVNHTVAIKRSAEPRARARVGYRLNGVLDDAFRSLSAAGYEVERRSDVSPTETEVLHLQEPQTGIDIHLYDESVEVAGRPDNTFTPLKLGHVAAFVPELQKMQTFYEELLGFKWSDTLGDFFVFLRCDRDHHAANFLRSQQYHGMHHIAYELRDLNHVQTMLDHLASLDIRLHWGPGRHGPGHNIFTYHKDPDGNVVELFTQLDQINESEGYFEPRPWHEDRPQYPKTWEADFPGNVWGPPNLDVRER